MVEKYIKKRTKSNPSFIEILEEERKKLNKKLKESKGNYYTKEQT